MNILREALDEAKAKTETNTSTDVFKSAFQEAKKPQINKIFQYDPNALASSLEGYFKENPNNDQRYIRETRGKPWTLEDTPIWGLGKTTLQGARGLATGATQGIFHGYGESAYGDKPKHGGAWENLRYYAGMFGPTHLVGSGLETIGEVVSGLYMLSTGAVTGIAGAIEKAIPGYEEMMMKHHPSGAGSENIQKFNEMGDWIKNKFGPYEKKRALASTMAVLMSDDVDAINALLDQHFGEPENKHTVEMSAAQMLSRRTDNKEYTESDIAKAITKIYNEYQAIRMSPEDWSAANAFWEGLTGHFTSADAFEKKMLEDPAEPLLDLIDVWEVATGFKNLGKLGRAAGDFMPTPKHGQTPGGPGSGIHVPDQLGIDQGMQRAYSEQPSERMEFPLGQEESLDVGGADVRTDPAGDRGQYRPEFAPEVAGGMNESPGQLTREIERLQGLVRTAQAELRRFQPGTPAHTRTRENLAQYQQELQYSQSQQETLNISQQETNDLINNVHNIEILSNTELIGYRDALQAHVDEVAAAGIGSTPPENITQMQAALDTYNLRIRDIGLEPRPNISEPTGDDLMGMGNFDQQARQLEDGPLQEIPQDAQRPSEGYFDDLMSPGSIPNSSTLHRIEQARQRRIAEIRGQNSPDAEQSIRELEEASPDEIRVLLNLDEQGNLRSEQMPTDPLQGETARSASGFDTRSGEAAARQGREVNPFDNETTYPDADIIMARLDEVYNEIDGLTPNDVRRRKQLEQEIEQATQALRNRIPNRRGRGVRLNMGIDPTQLGSAAREIWRAIRKGVHKTLSEPERIEFPTKDRTGEDFNELRRDITQENDNNFETGRAEDLNPSSAFHASMRDAIHQRSERGLRESMGGSQNRTQVGDREVIGIGDKEGLQGGGAHEFRPRVSGGIDELDINLDAARRQDAKGHRSELSASGGQPLANRPDHGFGDLQQYPDADSVLARMQSIGDKVDTLTPEDVATARSLLDELQSAQDELEWRAEQAGLGEGPRLRSGVDPTEIANVAKELWQRLVRYIQKKFPGIEEVNFPRSDTIDRGRAEQGLRRSLASGEIENYPMVSGGTDEDGFIRLNRDADPDELQGAAQRDVERLRGHLGDRSLREDVSAFATGVFRDLDASKGVEAGEAFGRILSGGGTVPEAMRASLGMFAESFGKAFQGDRLYNRAAAKGDSSFKALKDIYEKVGLKASDSTIRKHLKTLEARVGEGQGASIVVDILNEVGGMTIEGITYPEVKNLLNNKLRQKGSPTKLGKKVVDFSNTTEVIDRILEVIGETPGGRYASPQDPPGRKIRALIEGVIQKRNMLENELDAAKLEELLKIPDIEGHPYIVEMVRRGENQGRTGLDRYDRKDLAQLIHNARHNPDRLGVSSIGRGDTAIAEHFFETLKQLDDPKLQELIGAGTNSITAHDLVDLWRAVYDRYFSQQSDTTAFDHKDIRDLLNAIQEDLSGWANKKNKKGAPRQDRVSIRTWLKTLEKRQDKISIAFRKSAVESLKNMKPNQLFDTFTSLDTNTIQSILEMLGGREDNISQIPVNKRQQEGSAFSDAEIKDILKNKGIGKRGKGQDRVYSPVEKLDLIRTVFVDQLLAKTYARSRKSAGRDNPMQIKDADQAYIHTLQELLDDIDLRDGASTGRGELIFGKEVWDNLRNMRPSNELFHWLTTAQAKLSRGQGGLGLKLGAGSADLLTSLLPFLRSTEHGKEFYRDVLSGGQSQQLPFSEFLSMLFSQTGTAVVKAAPKTKIAARGASRARANVEKRSTDLPIIARNPSTTDYLNAR